MCDNPEISRRLIGLERKVDGNTRTLRGSNGDAGLVGSVALLAEQIKTTEKILLTEIKTCVGSLSVEMKSEKEQTVRFPAIRKHAIPFIMTITGSILTAWLMIEFALK